jgi:CRISPR-associated endoribonuclease Cas6
MVVDHAPAVPLDGHPLCCAEYRVLPLDGPEPTPAPGLRSVPRWAGPYAQAWYLRWVADQAPELAHTLHAVNARKPYALGIDMRSGWLRLTSYDLHQAPLPTPAEAAEAVTDLPTLTLLGHRFRLERTAYRTITFAALIRAGGDDATLPALTFETPTLFRSGGLDSPLPTPDLVFGGLARHWDAICPLPLPITLKPFIEQYVAIADASIRTRRVRVPHKGGRVGFIGRVRFQVTTRGQQADPRAAHLLAALLRFAPYVGVGAGTAAGFGSVTIKEA